jgi:hypothetical protein
VNAGTVLTSASFVAVTSVVKKHPNEKGFIQHWLVLSPVTKDIARNNIYRQLSQINLSRSQQGRVDFFYS